MVNSPALRRVSHLSPEAEQARASWQYRCIAATEGQRSKLGQIIIAILGRAPNNPPRICSPGFISKDGTIYCAYQDQFGGVVAPFILCSTIELRDNLRGLADHLALSDRESEELFAEARKWIKRDARVETAPIDGGPAVTVTEGPHTLN
jgi:hypothetical protein